MECIKKGERKYRVTEEKKMNVACKGDLLGFVHELLLE